MLRSTAQLTIAATADGARITFGEETLVLHGVGGAPLDPALLASLDMLDVSRVPLPDMLPPPPPAPPKDTPKVDDPVTKGDDNGDDADKGADWDDIPPFQPGPDGASYAAAAAGLLADLQFAHLNTGVAAGDTYVSIENLQGSRYKDDLRGDGADNMLWGGDGQDTLHGRDGDDRLFGEIGDDTLLGGAGADLLHGGAGVDMAGYWTDGAGVLADLGYAHLNTGAAAGDTYDSIEGLKGSRYKDDLRGDDRDNSLFGGDGDDKLHGRGGDDRLVGGNGDDLLQGGAGADRLEGGAGIDRAAYYVADLKIIADLQFAHVNTGDAAGDTYDSIENMQGGDGQDDLRGDGAANTLWGHDNDDILHGRGGDDFLLGDEGDDVLFGGAGADRLEGGAGVDRAAYWTAPGPVLADLGYAHLNEGEAAGDTYDSIEDVQGSDASDRLRGDAGDNRIWGGEGNDVLHGRDGNDRLLGQEGRDYMVGGAGDDHLTGGAGADTFVFEAGHDIIADFTAGEDRLQIAAEVWDDRPLTVETLASHATSGAEGLHLDFGSAGSVILLDFTDLTLLETSVELI
jgi:Ca2+-binding RTX toxin-like protein